MRTYIVIPQFLVTDELVELAEQAITSLKKYYDVFLISVDDSGEYPKAKRADEVMALSDLVLTNKKNSGFAVTCNNGFRWIMENEKEDCWIVCANNDIEVYDGWLEAMKEPWELFDNVAVSGIIHCMLKIRENKPLGELHGLSINEGGLLGDYMQDGGLLLMKKSVMEITGMYDEQFQRGGFEDIDLFLRMRDTLGMKIIMSDKCQYWHKEGSTRWNTMNFGEGGSFGAESKRIEPENLQRFINKWGYNPNSRQIWRSNTLRN